MIREKKGTEPCEEAGKEWLQKSGYPGHKDTPPLGRTNTTAFSIQKKRVFLRGIQERATLWMEYREIPVVGQGKIKIRPKVIFKEYS